MSKILLTSRLPALCRTHPCMIITTLHENGVVNAGTFGAYTIVGPEEIGVAIGKPSHTYQNIKRTGEFVINVPSIEIARACEICGMDIPPEESELEHAGLTTAPAAKVRVPLIAECVANVECVYWKELEIGYHSFVAGKTVAGHIREDLVDRDGGLDVIKARVAHVIRYPETIYAVLSEPRDVMK